jgi:hypothetical protein
MTSAILKVYTDNAHTSEVAHTAAVSTTLNNGGTLAIGAVGIICTTVTNMPAQGVIDIDTAGNLETIPYTSITSNTLNLAWPTTISHANSVAVVQWVYTLAVGDQTNGILNDGTNATPNGSTNVATWYAYNAGGQTAQSPVFATANTSPSTTSGYADTVISITSISAGFSTSVSPSNIAAGSQQQFWVCEQIPTGQSQAGNPQQCVVNLSYSSI